MNSVSTVIMDNNVDRIHVFGQKSSLAPFVMANRIVIHKMKTLLAQSLLVNDVFVMSCQGELYPQLVAVDEKGNKLAHVILSDVVVSGKADPLIFLDSPDFLLAGVAN